MCTRLRFGKYSAALVAICTGLFVGATMPASAQLTFYSRTTGLSGSIGNSFRSATTWTLDMGNPAGAAAPRGPDINEGDTCIIRAGHVVRVNPVSSAHSTGTLIIEDGELNLDYFLYTNDLDIEAPGSIDTAAGGAIYFWGNVGNPASYTSANNTQEISYFYLSNFDIEDGGYAEIYDPIEVRTRIRVDALATIEFLDDGALVDNIGPAFNPSSSNNYLFGNDSTIVYNTGAPYTPGLELQPQESFSNSNISRGPRNLTLRMNTEVNLNDRPAGTYRYEDFVIEPEAVFTDQDNDDGVDITRVENIDLQDDGEIRKTIDETDVDWGTNSIIDFGVAGAQIDFSTLPTKKGPGVDSVRVEREGNDPNGPNGGTLTLEHYRIIPSSGSAEIQELSLPAKGFAPTFPRICRRDLTDIPPGITSTCFAAILTSLDIVTDLVTYDSTGQPSTHIDSTEMGPDNLIFVHDGQDPLLVDLMSFEAVVSRTGLVSLIWETAAEIDNVGFHVYRADEEGHVGEQLTTTIIPAEGTSWAGAVYVFEDPVPLTNGKPRYYYLEDVDANGVRSLHGPVEATANRSFKGKAL